MPFQGMLKPFGRTGRAGSLTVMLGFAAASSLAAADEKAALLTAAESDPRALGWMQGHPPPPGKVIRPADADAFTFPKLRWSACHFRALQPTAGVDGHGSGTIPFERAPDSGIDGVTFTPLGGHESMTWQASLAANYTDGIVVLHHGKIVYEWYSGCLDHAGQHGAMSVTKSVVGLLAETLVAEGALDETATVASIVPELASSGFGGATVRQVLDMITGLDYSEDYADPDSGVWRYAKAISPLPKPGNYDGPDGIFGFLQTVRPEGKNGEAFAYKTVNADAVGWIITRVTGHSVADLLSARVWSKMGAEQDSYFTVDSTGTPVAGGGLSAGLRDLARVGQIALDGGRINGRQVVPAAAITRIRQGGDPRAFAKAGYDLLKGWSYRGLWWVTNNDHGAFTARGIHGQAIYVDPAADMVIARFASHPVANNAANDPTSLPAYHAVAEYLVQANQ